jgi:hypothetical protein
VAWSPVEDEGVVIGGALTAVRRERLRRLVGPLTDRRTLTEFGRIPLHHPDLPFVLLASQKAGSTTTAKWFFSQAGLSEVAAEHGRWIHDYEHEVFTRRRGYLRSVRRAIAGGIDVVKVVRDPAGRAFSGYLQLNEHWAVLNRADHWTVFWRTRLIRDLFGADADYIRPFSFLEYLTWLSRQHPHRVNPHLAPQRTGLEERLGPQLHLLRLEDGPAVFTQLEARYGLRPTTGPELGSLLTSGHHTAKAPVAAAELRSALREGYLAHRPEGSRFPELDTQTLADDPEAEGLVRAWFAVDYDAYGHLYEHG